MILWRIDPLLGNNSEKTNKQGVVATQQLVKNI
jgi:hypothetical protein